MLSCKNILCKACVDKMDKIDKFIFASSFLTSHNHVIDRLCDTYREEFPGVSHNLSMTLLQQVNIAKNVKNRRKTSITGFTNFNVFASLIIHKKFQISLILAKNNIFCNLVKSATNFFLLVYKLSVYFCLAQSYRPAILACKGKA